MIAAVVLVWLATSLLVGAVWALATYRRESAVDSRPADAPVPALPRPRVAAPSRARQHAGSR